jgi:hypothetical protein
MPCVIRDVVDDINKAVTKRWRHLDPLLPEPSDLPEGCMPPLLVTGDNSRPSGLGVCRHQYVAADTLAQTWGAATKFVLSMRLRGPDVAAAADDLITQWRTHLVGQQQAYADDTAAVVNWPSRDVTGVPAILRHGLQPLTVIAVRPKARPANVGTARDRPHPAALLPGEPAVGAVLAPDGIPPALVHLGGAPGGHPALTTRSRSGLRARHDSARARRNAERHLTVASEE